MELHLTAEEQDLLTGILERRHHELQKEIRHTDHREFRETLRHNEEVIESLLNQLRSVHVAKAS